MKQTLHVAGWQCAMNVAMKQTLHLAGWHYAMKVNPNDPTLFLV
jgi:hypothetical protein